jgi:hypothetical protein
LRFWKKAHWWFNNKPASQQAGTASPADSAAVS